MSALSREVLLLFLRHPEPGRVKTRLIPALGPDRAAEVYERLLEIVIDGARQLARPGLSRIACVEPASRAADVAGSLGPGFEVVGQREGDLGQRMEAAFAEAFRRGAARVVIVGTDCPGVDAPLLNLAFDALFSHDAALGPALDGGYYLLGLSRPMPAVFRGIPWSSPETAARTLDALETERAWVRRLPSLRDLDDAADLEALAPHWPRLACSSGHQ